MKKLTPEELKEKIEKMRQGPERKGGSEFARGLSFVTSFGFATIICILLGVWLGRIVVEKTGNELWLPVFIFLGIIFAAYTAYKMLKPFLKTEDRRQKTENK